MVRIGNQYLDITMMDGGPIVSPRSMSRTGALMTVRDTESHMYIAESVYETEGRGDSGKSYRSKVTPKSSKMSPRSSPKSRHY